MDRSLRIIGLYAFMGMLILLLSGIAYYNGYLSPILTTPHHVASPMPSHLPALGGHFELIDERGKVRTERDFFGKYQLVYFGYSFCPDICPAALTTMTTALHELGNLSDQVTPIFITIDPERDTSPHLASYKESFHPNLVCLTGSPSQTHKAQTAFRVYAKKAKPDGTSTDYLLDHSSLIYVMDRQGRCVALFSHASQPHDISQKLKSLIEKERKS